MRDNAGTHTLSTRELAAWRTAQVAIWAAGMFVWAALFFKPALGLHLLWNVLIPVAPALLVVAPGVWRNVCPLASLSLAPHHFGVSRRKMLSAAWRGRLYLGALLLLLVVVPLRKVLLDTNGPVLAAVLLVVGLLAVALGWVFNQKSAWCSSLCPVYPVELLYGSRPVVSVPNAHCPRCWQCVAPCSESTAELTPRSAVKTRLGKAVGVVLTGCFPGFVWGWYHVPTYRGWEGLSHLHLAFGIPYAVGGLTLLVYLALGRRFIQREEFISRSFAAAAVMTYYWYRLPPMFGIGDPHAAMIADVSAWLPAWSAAALRAGELAAFGWLLLIPRSRRHSWETQPAPAEKSSVRTTFGPSQSLRR